MMDDTPRRDLLLSLINDTRTHSEPFNLNAPRADPIVNQKLMNDRLTKINLISKMMRGLVEANDWE